MNQVIATKAPAKINCFLKIMGRLPNGYHTIYTLFRKISLWDQLTIGVNYAGSSPKIEVRCHGLSGIPNGRDNLAFKAADLFMKKTGIMLDVRIDIKKTIPPGAGLGGGSSDASCVLRSLNTITGNPLSQTELLKLASSIGADCPFFLLEASSAVGLGIGDDLYPVKIPKQYFVLIFPNFFVNTRWAYAHYVLTKSEDEISFVPEKLADFMHWANDLEGVVLKKYPVLKTYKKQLINHGAKIALMTGSGSTIFGLFSNLDAAQRAKEAISRDFEIHEPLNVELAESL
ncbi:4-diphosphocytidyl-2-C-methyl-D-erythritol kinase [Dissulfuribacter thermophilus]|uniref:4-diphosphocytidyl-2-C-methyl-D-erythritol kinase n=1 Tax=Dissulfuribacter thermophilus TaxID=1156395 RepID=A0A1B9F6G3_9BACT|nr:4-(cytidine 5'-diphospho)-2-C-methyl-D-erythritol kinase [Dissulfuribacter thermophilus]OCC15361.1 4-diphosphocytidyl-2-C-methyl-D-erythritol kinase [Dissulfuribacter thermophilus]